MNPRDMNPADMKPGAMIPDAMLAGDANPGDTNPGERPPRDTPRGTGLLAIDDALAAPFEVSDLGALLAPAGVTVRILPATAVCPTCGEGACDHVPERLAAVEQALRDMAGSCAGSCGRVIVAGAGSSASLALLLAANEPEVVRGCILVRPRLGKGAPGESLAQKLLRRLAWPRRVLVGAEPAPKPDGAAREMGGARGRIAGLGGRLCAIAQPTLIIHARGRRCDDLDDAWLLQRELGGMVEMLTVQAHGDGSHAGLGAPALERLAAFMGEASAAAPRPKAAVERLAVEPRRRPAVVPQRRSG